MDIERAIGRLESCVSGLKSDVDEMKADVKALRSIADQAKGGWKFAVGIASVGGVVGATLTKIMPWLMAGPR